MRPSTCVTPVGDTEATPEHRGVLKKVSGGWIPVDGTSTGCIHRWVQLWSKVSFEA